MSLAIWGQPLIDNVITAQREAGLQLGALPGYLAQAGWNLGPLLLLAGTGLLCASQLRDPALARTCGALLIATTALVGTVAKRGTSLNVIELAEPVAIVLAAPGLLLLASRPSRPQRLAGIGALLLVLAQSVSFLVAPYDKTLFNRPFSARAVGGLVSGHDVALAVRRARNCPPGAAYSGTPYVAFLAHRHMPGDQPDLFLLHHAPRALRSQRARISGALCPPLG